MSSRQPLFARRISITDFRGYGRFVLDLPPSPCVVLLSGPNGLGKTSFFEAIEWCLTGAVKRLDLIADGRASPRDLVRIADGVTAFEISISFREGTEHEEHILRTQLVPSNGTPPPPIGTHPARVAEYISSDETRWNVNGTNLADYLHLTHIHTQSASLRFVTFSAKDRWMRVSPLAGADRFERVRTNLINAKAALTKVRERRQLELDKAVERRRQWGLLAIRIEELRKLAGARQDILTPNEALTRVAEFAVELGAQHSVLVREGDVDVSAASDEVHSLRVEVERRISEISIRNQELRKLRSLTRRFTDANAQLVSIQARRRASEQSVTALHAEMVAAALRLDEVKVSAAEKQHLAEAAFALHETLRSLIQFDAESKQSAQELAIVESQLKDISVERDMADAVAQRARQELSVAEQRIRDHQLASRQLELIIAAEKSLREVTVLQERMNGESIRRAALSEVLRNLESMRSQLVLEVTQARTALEASSLTLDNHKLSVVAMQSAVIAIADHLRALDTKCPVCQTDFAVGELRRLALNSLDRVDPEGADIERVVSAARAELERLINRDLDLEREHRGIESELRALEENSRQMDARMRQLTDQQYLKNLEPASAAATLARLRTEMESELRRLANPSDASQSALSLRESLLEVTARAAALSSAQNLIRDRRNGRSARLEECDARRLRILRQYPQFDIGSDALSPVASEAALGASKARDDANVAMAELAEASARSESLRQAEQSILTQVTSFLEEERSVTSDRDLMLKTWTSALVPPPISDDSLDSELEVQLRREREFERVLVGLSAVLDGLQRWRSASELQAAEDQARKERNLASVIEHTAQLEREVEFAQHAVETSRRARAGADQLSDRIGEVASNVSAQALQPFDVLFQRYLRALVHDERFHRIQASYEPSARSAGLSFKVALQGRAAEAENILSEGQVGEVSLAAMLAASSAFPWSRWRTLLLDDPTQYNDLIHTTALFDVLRNLVRVAGYQIFISTHDSEQAGFLRRKLDGIGIPWVDCRYVAHDADGIAVEVDHSEPRRIELGWQAQ